MTVSPARTSGSSPSLMHLDVGEVDLTSHIHVLAVSVQSHVPSDVLYNCTGLHQLLDVSWFLCSVDVF